MADETFRSVMYRSISTGRHDRIEAAALGGIRCSTRTLTVSSRFYNFSGGAQTL
jgi:hypothetical protein